MRNLKRALSLALASIMLLGTMAIGAGAHFTDPDTITHTQAVDVLVALDVFEGFDDGSFGGDRVVTRGQMAKLLVSIVKGSDYNVNGFVGFDVFPDVDGHWSEGYVNVGVANGLIEGYDDGTFGPDRIVTTAEAAVMLSRAIGYFQNGEDTGSMWMLNGIVTATENGILDGLELVASQGLTRDDLALMIFNTVVSGEGVNFITDSTSSDYQQYVGQGTYLAKTVFGMDDTGSFDTLGRPTIQWKLDGDVIATGSVSPDHTYVGTDDGWSDIQSDVKADYYTTDSDNYDKANTDEDSITPADGLVIEVYEFNMADDDKDYAYVLSYYYVAGVVDSVGYDEDDDQTTVKIDGENGKTVSYVVDGNSAKLAEGDTVIFATTDGTNADDVALATTVSGSINSLSTGGNYVNLDGTRYDYAANTDGVAVADVALGTEYTLVLDPNGYVIFAQGEEDSSIEDYVYISAFGTSSFDTVAKAYFMDGTTKSIVVDEMYTVSGGSYTEYTTEQYSNKAAGLFEYSEDDGEYTLYNIESTLVNTTATANIERYEMDYNGKEFTDATVFVSTADGVAYTGFESVANFTITAAGQVLYVLDADATGEIAVVFIVGVSANTSATDDTFVFVTDADDFEYRKGDDDATYAVYFSAYVDGVAQSELWVKSGLNVTGTAAGIQDMTMYQVTSVTEDGYVDGIDTLTFDGQGYIRNVGSSYLYTYTDGKINNYTMLSYDADTVFVHVDVTDADGIDLGDTVSAEDATVSVGSAADIVTGNGTSEGDDVSYLYAIMDGDYLEFVLIYTYEVAESQA